MTIAASKSFEDCSCSNLSPDCSMHVFGPQVRSSSCLSSIWLRHLWSFESSAEKIHKNLDNPCPGKRDHDADRLWLKQRSIRRWHHGRRWWGWCHGWPRWWWRRGSKIRISFLDALTKENKTTTTGSSTVDKSAATAASKLDWGRRKRSQKD